MITKYNIYSSSVCNKTYCTPDKLRVWSSIPVVYDISVEQIEKYLQTNEWKIDLNKYGHDYHKENFSLRLPTGNCCYNKFCDHGMYEIHEYIQNFLHDLARIENRSAGEVLHDIANMED